MLPLDSVIRSSGFFLRRRDLLALGYTDAHLRTALAQRRIFRVRQGWYSVPDAPDDAVMAVRVGGRLTGLSALASFGLPVPRSSVLQVVVRPTASRLRNPVDRRVRLDDKAAVCVSWSDSKQTNESWRVTPRQALLAVLLAETRDIAVACCSAAQRRKLVTASVLDEVFAIAPERVRGWRRLVSALDDSHGETFVRLWLRDAHLPCQQQARVPGVGRIDFRLSSHVYLEVDGAQHDPGWSGAEPGSWERDHDRDTTLAIRGDRVLRVTYRQLYGDWPRVLAAIERAIADDAALASRRRRHPYRPRGQQKRRRFAAKLPP
ncbi:MAG: hypothetical protein ABI632_07075 [Pseudolysinimonas sp.]